MFRTFWTLISSRSASLKLPKSYWRRGPLSGWFSSEVSTNPIKSPKLSVSCGAASSTAADWSADRGRCRSPTLTWSTRDPGSTALLLLYNNSHNNHQLDNHQISLVPTLSRCESPVIPIARVQICYSSTSHNGRDMWYAVPSVSDA